MIDKSISYDDKDKDTDIGDNFYTYKIPDTQRAMTNDYTYDGDFNIGSAN